jgi:2-polyprenyl-3-methyl-5-hydroxy-6-metoxy-1,4-benzoquinol methylase
MNCNNCGSSSPNPFLNVKCYYTDVPLSVVRCSICNLIYLDPRPDKSLGLEYFEKAYSNAEGFESHSYYRNHEQIFARNNERFSGIKDLPVPNKKLLDFGAGQGHFVKTALDHGWQATGTELSPAAIKAAKDNLNVTLIDSLQNLESNDFSVITLWDVIEHLEDPKATLLELSKYLHPKGYFIIETSNIDSLDYLVLKKKWSYWHVDHLFYFSKRSLISLLEKIGFKSIESSRAIAAKKIGMKGFSKYKSLINPSTLFLALKKRWYSKRFKEYSRNSLMTVVFQRNSKN